MGGVVSMDRPYYKPARLGGYSRHDDDCNPLVIVALVLAGFAVTVALGAMWLLCFI